MHDRVHGIDPVLAAERRVPGHHFVEHRAEAEDVAARVDAAAVRLLGRHVRRRSEHQAGVRQVPDRRHGARVAAERVEQLGEPEVDDLGVAVLGDHCVGRLQVAVDDAGLVRAGERFGHLDREVQRPDRTQRPAGDDLAERLAAQQLHGDEGDALGLANLVNHGDVRMLEGRRGARLLHEPVASHGIGDERGRQHLQRDVAVETRITGPVHLAHAAGAEWSENLVRTEALSGCEEERAARWRHRASRECGDNREPALEYGIRLPVGAEELLDVPSELRVVRTLGGKEPGTLGRWERGCVEEELLDARPAISVGP